MKIQSLLAGLSVLVAAYCSAQTISDYKFIIVPTKFTDFKENQYQLNSRLASSLAAKNYTILTENEAKWPIEVQQNPCSALTADVKNNSNMLRNRLIVAFSDCRKNIIQDFKTVSLEKDFEVGFQDALQKAALQVAASAPKSNTLIAENSRAIAPAVVSSPVKETTPQTSSAQVNSSLANTTSLKAEVFTWQNEDFQKVQIGNGQFILVSGSSSLPLATFTPTTRTDVFRVQLRDGNMTLGYLENGNLSVEMPASDGKMVKQVFQRK